MKFDFDRKLKKFSGEYVPTRAFMGGLGETEQAKIQEVADALAKAEFSPDSTKLVLETLMNANDEPLTLGELLKTILLEGIEEKSRTSDGRIIPKQVEPRAKIRRGKLAEKIWDGGIVEISDKERSLAKDLAAAILGPELAYLAHRALDKPIVDEDEDEDAAEDAAEDKKNDEDEDAAALH